MSKLKAGVQNFPECPHNRTDCTFVRGTTTSTAADANPTFLRDGTEVTDLGTEMTEWRCTKCLASWRQVVRGGKEEWR